MEEEFSEEDHVKFGIYHGLTRLVVEEEERIKAIPPVSIFIDWDERGIMVLPKTNSIYVYDRKYHDLVHQLKDLYEKGTKEECRIEESYDEPPKPPHLYLVEW